MSGFFPRFRLQVVDEILSTNLALLERVEDFHGQALLAKRQSAGIGRRGRVWDSPEGNLALSFALSFEEDEALMLLPFAVGIALFDTAAEFVGGSECLSLKWPNDLYANGKKMAGLLTQVRQQGSQKKVVVGVGMNLLQAPPPEFVRVPAIALRELNDIAPSAESFARTFLQRLENGFKSGLQFIEIKKEWSSRCKHLGVEIFYQFSEHNEAKKALALGLLPSGELLVRDILTGKEQALSSEEVSIGLEWLRT